jgi:hypothetical protein
MTGRRKALARQSAMEEFLGGSSSPISDMGEDVRFGMSGILRARPDETSDACTHVKRS